MSAIRKVRPSPILRVASARSQAAVSEIRLSGFSLPSSPEDSIPAVPQDITELDDDALMHLFSELTAWSDYVSAQCAIAQIDERDAQRSLDLAEAQATGRHWTGGSGDRVAVMKKKVAEDDDVIRALDTLDERYAYRKLVEVLAGNLDRDIALVSRELTRRTAGSAGLPKRKDRWTT